MILACTGNRRGARLLTPSGFPCVTVVIMMISSLYVNPLPLGSLRCLLELEPEPLSECPSRLTQATRTLGAAQATFLPQGRCHTIIHSLKCDTLGLTELRIQATSLSPASRFRFTSPNVAFLGCAAFN